jgi:hypothetical protein
MKGTVFVSLIFLLVTDSGNAFDPLRPFASKHKVAIRHTARSASVRSEDIDDIMAGPDIIYPPEKWAWKRAQPKSSLKKTQKNPAPAWMLNIVELAHWVSFPIGFQLAHYLFTQAPTIAVGTLGGDTTRVFLIILGILNQVFGGGMAVLMHVYEGWMIAPFNNLLLLPKEPSSSQVDKIRTQDYNNAWLRAAAYQMLMTFQSLGLSLFTMGTFGIKLWTKALVLGTVAIALIGPKEPRLKFTRTMKDGEERPVLPLSISLVTVLGVNVIFQLVASYKLFYHPLVEAWPLCFPFLRFVPAGLGALIGAILPSTLQGAGGGMEGYFAESSFKQWQHLGAFLVLLSGFLLLGGAFRQLVAFNAAGQGAAALAYPAYASWLLAKL